MDSLEFMNETWESLYKRSSMVDKKSLDVQMLAFSISAVLQKTQAYIKAHHNDIAKNTIPKLKTTLQEIKTMISGLLEATQTQFKSHEELLTFIQDNYEIVQQFSGKLHEYLLNEKPNRHIIGTPSPLAIERPSMFSFIESPKDRLTISNFMNPNPNPDERSSVRSSTTSNGHLSPLKERSIFPISNPKVTLIDDAKLDQFVCNEVLKCYHFIIQKYPRTKKHLPLLDLSGNADESDEQFLNHFLTDLCDGVIFCRLYNIFAEDKSLDLIDKIFKPAEWYDRMELLRRCQKQSIINNWDIYTVKKIAIDIMSISKKTIKGNKHVCALFIKLVHVVGKDLNSHAWEENLARWIEFSKI